jgi:hypothetical protein
MLLTRIVLRRKKLANAVLAAIRVHGPRVVAKLEELFALKRQEGQPVPNYSGDLADLENNLVEAYDKIETADDVNLKDVVNDRRLRRLRDGAAKILQQVLLKLSQTVDSSYGPQKAEEILGLGAGLRAIPDQIYDVGRRARDILATPDFAFEQPALKGVGLAPAELLEDVDGPLQELGDHLETLREARREGEETLNRKLEAIAEFDATFTMVATWLKGMFLGAGEKELAKRIRPRIPAAAKAGDDQVVEVDDETGEEREVDPEGSETPPPSSPDPAPAPSPAPSTEGARAP